MRTQKTAWGIKRRWVADPNEAKRYAMKLAARIGARLAHKGWSHQDRRRHTLEYECERVIIEYDCCLIKTFYLPVFAPKVSAPKMFTGSWGVGGIT